MIDAAQEDETFELVPLAAGGYSLRSRANGQTFHPVVGPAAEAKRLHVDGTRTVERAAATARVCVWDVGLGAAANVLTAIDAVRAACPAASLQIHSFDRTRAALDFALANADALGYPRGHEEALRALLDTGRVETPPVSWWLHLGDFPTLLASALPLDAPHAIFYDPYSPTINPEMWTLEVFTALFARVRPQVPCLLTTYTRSTAVRVTLLLAGFYVGVGPSTGEKDETTVAANDPALLERPLSREWLEKKVYASTNAAPLRADGTPGPINPEDFARLQAHGQFAV